jgi:hypothetical protein
MLSEIFFRKGLDSQMTDLPVGANQRNRAGEFCPHAQADWDGLRRSASLGTNHFPEGGNRDNQIEHWNGKRTNSRRNPDPARLLTPQTLRKIANNKHRSHECHKNQKRGYVHSGLLLSA